MPTPLAHHEDSKTHPVRHKLQLTIVPATYLGNSTKPRPQPTHFLAFSLASMLSSDDLLTRTNHPLTGPAPPFSSTYTTRASAFASCPPRAWAVVATQPRSPSRLGAGNVSESRWRHHTSITRSLALRIYSMLTRSSQGVPLASLTIITQTARIYVLFVEANMCRPHGRSRRAQSVVRMSLFKLFDLFPPFLSCFDLPHHCSSLAPP